MTHAHTHIHRMHAWSYITSRKDGEIRSPANPFAPSFPFPLRSLSVVLLPITRDSWWTSTEFFLLQVHGCSVKQAPVSFKTLNSLGCLDERWRKRGRKKIEKNEISSTTSNSVTCSLTATVTAKKNRLSFDSWIMIIKNVVHNCDVTYTQDSEVGRRRMTRL